ncbi:MAG: hypothetical protein BWY82_00240 [Verrucomicrobia bacterium ADurb.Bin474]|nr:MAG: hypothetical protein BWY82_00240 [Verrucomicrobia bacterium ADurb.Bin474]
MFTREFTVALISLTSPSSCFSRVLLMTVSKSSDIGAGTNWQTNSGCCLDSLTISCASVRFIPIRASHNTCLPACKAATVASQCNIGQVPMHTASILGSSTISRQFSATLGIPKSSATARALARRRLETTAHSTPGIA